VRPSGHRRRHRPGGTPDRREAGPAPGNLCGRDAQDRRHHHRQADAGGRVYDHQGADPLPADLHQGAEYAALHERLRRV